ncbi:MAG: fibronectin type III domain-containing protein [Patescibacteria group bacterium]|nr:fibronectin type III domain-containing protein [Patescibacteria group bacterium]
MNQRTATTKTVGMIAAILLGLGLLHYVFTNFSQSVSLLGSGLTAFVSAFNGHNSFSLPTLADFTGISGNGGSRSAVARSGGQTATSSAVNGVHTVSIVKIPGQVSNLNAVAGVNQVSLNWSEPSQGAGPITYYLVYRGTYAGGESFAEAIHSTSWTDTDVSPGYTYYYKVLAVNAYGNGPYSNEVSAAPYQSLSYVAPASSLLASSGYGQITLTWSAPTSLNNPVSYYNVYRSVNNSTGFSYYAQTAGNNYVDDYVNSGNVYYYYVTAVSNGGSESQKSNTASATPLSTAPSAVSGLSASASGNTVILNWSYGGSIPASYFNVYRGTNNSDVSFYASTTGNSTSFTDSGVSSGNTYYYEVSAVNSSGAEGALSNETNISIQSQSQEPLITQVTNLSVSQQSGGVSLSWSYSGGAASYFNIYRSASDGSMVFYASTQGTYYLDDAVTSGNTYAYQVSAVNAYDVEGPLSGAASITYNSSPSYEPYSANQSVSLSVSEVSGGIELSWSYSGPAASSFNIYRGVNQIGTAYVTSAGGTSFLDTGVYPGNIYYYQISPVNASTGLQGSLSNEVSLSY